MTVALSSQEIAKRIEEKFPGSVIEPAENYLLIKSDSLYEIAAFLKDTPDLDFKYLNYITAVDYYDYFEVIYQLTSIEKNHTMILKTRCYDRENPALPSVYNLWQGADFQEREIYDLMGITFQGHPNMKRIFLWDGFKGYPLRKEYL
jgi:NADH-quinone oxidoreductase subunit C